jgi:hypothetical protein
MTTRHGIGRIVISALALLCGACSHSNDQAPQPNPNSDFGDVFPADHFLQFLNRQYSLAGGTYTLVAGTSTAGQSGSYTLQVTYDDGSAQTFDGSWTSSGGPSSSDPNNPSQAITLSTPGGLTATMTSAVDGCLYLVDSGGTAIAPKDGTGAITCASSISLPKSKTDTPAYTNAYYQAAVQLNDPTNVDNRQNFNDWYTANGLDNPDNLINGSPYHVTFRDAVDLGYGRDIHFFVKKDCSVAVYVKNYQVTNVPGQNYGPLNVDAAVDQDERYHVGTNAIEFGPPPGTTGSCSDTSGYYARFYSFDPDGDQKRRTTINMDGRGEKAMPVPCIVCHGGRAEPLLIDGQFPVNINTGHTGDAVAHLQALKVDSFDYSTQAGYTRADQEAQFKLINQAVFNAYAASFKPEANTSQVGNTNQWDSTGALKVIASWYGGITCTSGINDIDNSLFNPSGCTLNNDTFADNYVPSGWTPDSSTGSPPPSSDTLYKDVISKDCRLCHLLRGTDIQADINLDSYGKFSGYASRIEELVYDDGLMPLAQLTFDDFYSVAGRPEELASFIPGFSRYDSTGAVLLPGRPVANPGPARTAPSPVTLNGIASVLADSYQWQITSTPTGATASLSDAFAVRPTLTANMDGDYTIQLVVFHDGTASDPATVTVTVDSAAPSPALLSFATDIKPLLQSDCVNCHKPHTPGPGVPRPPIYYSDPDQSPLITNDPRLDSSKPEYDPNCLTRDIYTDVRSRVNLGDPANSPLLLKPSGHHHGGNQRSGFDLSPGGDRTKYDIFLNWILEGARP